MKKITFLFIATLMSLTSFGQEHATIASVEGTSVFDVTMPSTALADKNLTTSTEASDDGFETIEETQFIENCWFFDGMLGFNGNYRGVYSSVAAVNLGVRIGTKWYLGELNIWQFGVQATWARVGATFGLPSPFLVGTSSTVTLHTAISAGFINGFQFTEKFGLEANLNIGFNMLYSFYNYNDGNNVSRATVIQPGVIVNPCAKFRIRNFAIGVDIAVLYSGPGTYNEFVNGQPHPNNPRVASAITLSIVSVTAGVIF